MKKIICDRCGEDDAVITPLKDGDKEYDLCVDCKEQFYKFMHDWDAINIPTRTRTFATE